MSAGIPEGGSPESDRVPLCTIPDLLRDGAAKWPDRTFLMLEDGQERTWETLLAKSRAAGHVLQSHGIERGQRVAIFLPNDELWLIAWWGAALAGAIIVPINIAYRGLALQTACERLDPVAIITDPELAARLEAPYQELVILATDLVGESKEPVPGEDQGHPYDVHCIISTSGTTGPSKGSLTTHANMVQMNAWHQGATGLNSEDVWLGDLPMFHLAALVSITLTMRLGGKVAVRSTPSLSDYWRVCTEVGCTWSLAVGTMAEYLLAQPPGEYDRSHRMRFLHASPLPSDPDAFKERFGLDGLCTAYGSTEGSSPMHTVLGKPVPKGTCGQLRPGFHARLADENDYEVPLGEPGELLLRTDDPWILSVGYLNDPEGTWKAWRNGWFHTGDKMRKDTDGFYYFVERTTDSIRRRGENISSAEVELEVVAHPAVLAAACIGIAEGVARNQELLVFYVVRPGHEVTPEQLFEFLVERAPHFMVPRYLEEIEELPLTHSHRVEKYRLRERGITEHTWDREANGLFLSRRGLVRKDVSR